MGREFIIFYIFSIKILYNICILQIFSPSYGGIFMFLTVLSRIKVFNFDLVHFMNFSFCFLFFVSLGNKSLPNLRSQRFSTLFSSRRFTVLAFTYI